MSASPTKVYLIPSPIAKEQAFFSVDTSYRRAIEECDIFFVEHISNAVSFCKKICADFNPSEKEWVVIHKKEKESEALFSEALRKKKTAGIISDCGCPCVGDPGALLVSEAHRMGADLIPLVGPSSILMGIMSSGLPAQHFSFNGYLPIKEMDRKKAILAYEVESLKKSATQIFIETPYRNESLFLSLLKYLSQDTRLCVATGIASPAQRIGTLSVGEWKRRAAPTIDKVETLFLFYAL